MSVNEEKPTPLATASASKQGFINFMVQILDFTPRSKREIDPVVLNDWRSGIRVLACDSHFDIAEPHASEMERLIEAREIGFGHAWPVSRLSTGLMSELRRIALPVLIIGSVLIMPKDFGVVTELPPTPASMAMAEMREAA